MKLKFENIKETKTKTETKLKKKSYCKLLIKYERLLHRL